VLGWKQAYHLVLGAFVVLMTRLFRGYLVDCKVEGVMDTKAERVVSSQLTNTICYYSAMQSGISMHGKANQTRQQ
jgi:hypothetical protein